MKSVSKVLGFATMDFLTVAMMGNLSCARQTGEG